MVFHWSLSDSKSSLVSRTLLSNLAILNNAVSSSNWQIFSPFINPLDTVPKAPITIGIIVTFMFHSFFNSLPRSWYLSFFSHFQFYSVFSRDSKVHNFENRLFCWLLLDLVFWPRLADPFVCQSTIGVNVFHYPGKMLVCAYTICSYGQI